VTVVRRAAGTAFPRRCSWFPVELEGRRRKGNLLCGHHLALDDRAADPLGPALEPLAHGDQALGVVALFGQSSGSVEPLNRGLLAQKGSLYVTRPTLNTYAAKRENLVAMANELFEVVKSGAVKIEVNQTYPLKDAAKAHADLAARKTTGSTVLTV